MIPISKKQVPLRISEELHKDLSRWADNEFRSINGQIEYILTMAVKKWKKEKSSKVDFIDDLGSEESIEDGNIENKNTGR